ncbi:F-box/LRR-repeat protein, partial [Thalictrum thalictroides]
DIDAYINKYKDFTMLPRDISQQIINELINSNCLTEVSLEAFRDCALQDIDLGEYPGVKDSWMDAISSQGSSLLSVDVSGSDVTDSGMVPLKDCENLQELSLSYCDQISDNGLKHLRGLVRSYKASHVVECVANVMGQYEMQQIDYTIPKS